MDDRVTYLVSRNEGWRGKSLRTLATPEQNGYPAEDSIPSGSKTRPGGLEVVRSGEGRVDNVSRRQGRREQRDRPAKEAPVPGLSRIDG